MYALLTVSPWNSSKPTDIRVGLTSICSTIILTITYRFNAAQVVRPSVLRFPTTHPSSPYISPIRQGLTYLSSLVGAILAISVTTLSDRAIVWMAQHNRSIYEPEYRLVFMFSMLFGVFGYVGWGVGNDQHMPWVGAVICITYAPSVLASSIRPLTIMITAVVLKLPLFHRDFGMAG